MTNSSCAAKVPTPLEKITLAEPGGGQAEIFPYGAHLASWQPAGQHEVLFMSRASAFAQGKPIRGGVPVIFPQFGDGPLPKHGFARTQAWTRTDSGSQPGVLFTLEDTADTRALWPHRFKLELCVILADSLRMVVRVHNRDTTAFSFQFALHTYFAVADIARVRLQGLRGTRLRDHLRGGAEGLEAREEITFDRETDQVHLDIPGPLTLRDEAGGRTIVIRQTNMADAVVWNPWIDKARALPDFGDDEYQRMVCVETGRIATPVQLDPGQSWEGETTFTCTSPHA